MNLGYCLPDFEQYGIKRPILTDLVRCPHTLISGKSGSGKSQTFLWYAYQMLMEKESWLYFSDFKGGKEYGQLRGNHAYAYADQAVQMIYDYYEVYTKFRKEADPACPHLTLAVEEWSGLLNYIESKDKKQKADLMGKVGEMLALGRGIGNGIGIALMVQRADSSNFSAGSREQFQNIVSFGRCSKEQKQMLFPDYETEKMRNFSAGQGIALVDGQGEAEEIIVPWIPEQDRLLERIREKLKEQPKLSQLKEL